jgi:hypothetical protein
LPETTSAWLAIAAAIAAWVGAAISFVNSRTARRSLRLAEAQEVRRRPILTLYLGEGYVRFLDSERVRVYAFVLSISNPSDTNNSVAEFGLQINYVTKQGLRASVVVAASPSLPDEWRTDASALLQAPLKVDAHQTVAGWLPFRVSYDLLGDGSIEDYALVATDTHGNRAAKETVIVREVMDVG